jgi:HEPN domain-containing protein
MKNNVEEAKRWLKEAERYLEAAEILKDKGLFHLSCFHSEQAAQKALKNYLYFKGERFIMIHSVGKLALNVSEFDRGFKQILVNAERLDRYYISTRYPDAFAFPAVPSESYNIEDAEQSIKDANLILNLVKNKIAEKREI